MKLNELKNELNEDLEPDMVMGAIITTMKFAGIVAASFGIVGAIPMMDFVRYYKIWMKKNNIKWNKQNIVIHFAEFYKKRWDV